MLKVKNIRSVTDFARNTRDHVARLQASGEPEVLTINGKAAVVVQDAEAYERLLELVDYVDTVRVLRERLGVFEAGERGRPMREAIEELAAEAGIDLMRR
jgi:PHD/YefM family antitoxin component YafN of YafNO toxin-antitoxin module